MVRIDENIGLSDYQKNFLIENYPDNGKAWCCDQLGLSESKVRRWCSILKLKINRDSQFYKNSQIKGGLSKVGRKKPEHSALMKQKAKDGLLESFINCNDEKKLLLSGATKKWQLENGHPKGFKGKSRSDKEKQQISINSKAMWKNKDSKVNTEDFRQMLSDRASVQMNQRSVESMYSRAKKGRAVIGGKDYYYRSSWEINVACYFEFLKINGEIKDWFYEVDTFWFENIKRGVRSYKPDFKIIQNDDTFYYEEVKGWMDDKSKTKLNRMRIYYPNIDIRILGKDRYKSISSKKSFIKGWGEF